MTVLLLIRHGDNELASKSLAGHLPGVHLNERGCRQAELLAKKLENFPIKAIFSSPLERAIETARPLADRLGLEVQVRDALIEVDYGELQGREFDQLEQTDLWRDLQAHPEIVRFPGGESLVETQERVRRELESLAVIYQPKEMIACFTHADVIRLAAAWFLNLNLNDFQKIVVSLGSVTVIQADSKHRRVLNLNHVMDEEWLQSCGKKRSSD